MLGLVNLLLIAGLLRAAEGAAMTTDSSCNDCGPTTEELTSTPTSSTTTTGAVDGLLCKSSSADYPNGKNCVGGCFALYQDVSDETTVTYGCKGDLDFSNFGYTITQCDTAEKDGQCNEYGDDEDCMRCCDNAEECNEAYTERCEFLSTASCGSTDESESGSGTVAASLSLLFVVFLLSHC